LRSSEEGFAEEGTMKALRFALSVLSVLVALVVSSGSMLSAADSSISGKWVQKVKASQPQVGMEFQAAGATLTGTVRVADIPPMAIRDGRIDGDRVTFKAMIREGDDEYPLIFSGRRSGNRIAFKCEVETNVPGEKTQLGAACIQSVTVTRVR
jgi:hypothetical protein